MFNFIFINSKKGIDKIRNNSQLFYTVLVAILIVGSFVFMTERFVSIATDAGDRLINIRVGSIQDSFVSFAGDKINDPDYLNKKIIEIIGSNETIKNFRIVVKNNSTTSAPQYVILASNDTSEIGKTDPEADFLYSLASSDSNNSLTIQLDNNGERLFETARAVKDEVGNVVGVVMTTQTLSQADKIINLNIRNSLILLVFIIVLILFLFLRLSKIIDYMQLYKKLKEVDQLKDDFISMASHELRTPLSIIRGYAEFIREAKELLPETKDFAQKIDISAKDLDNLVTEILDVSRIQQGRMSYVMEKINPNEIISSLVESFVLPAKEKKLSISYDKNGLSNKQVILVDKNRFKQALVNFIGNAVKYTKAGEVKIRQSVENDRLYIRISDTGIGMSAEERERLFEKFYRIKTKETEDIRGTGLGLWITAQIVQEMKGSISVESIKGIGSHFIVSFPIIG
jgi:signal transduction histidine kinase